MIQAAPSLAGNIAVSGASTGGYIVTFLNGLASRDEHLGFTGTAPMAITNLTVGGLGEAIQGAVSANTTANTVVNVLTLTVGQNQSAAVTTGVTTLSLDGLNNTTTASSTAADVVVIARPGIATVIGSTVSGATISGSLALDSESAATGKAFTVNDTPAVNDLVISANIIDGGLGGGTLYKFGSGLGQMLLTGNNTFSSTTTVTNGILEIGNGNALGVYGSTASGTVVALGASLGLQGGIGVGNEALTISGVGPLLTTGTDLHLTASGTTLQGAGALRNISGNNTWSGPIALATSTAIGSDLASGQLTINSVVSGAFVLAKVGAGTLEFGGTAANTYSGTTSVNEGVLSLNKAGTVAAITATLVIGDEILNGPSGTTRDIVRFGSAAGTGNIGAVTVVVTSSGLLDMATNGKSDTVGAITTEVGANSSATISLSSGNLTLGGTLTTLITGSATTSSPAATIISDGSGVLTLSASRSFAVNESLAPVELAITSPINGAFTVTKTLEGTLDLGAANGFSALTLSANSGAVVALTNLALGVGAVTVNSGSTLAFQGGANYNSPLNTVTINGGGASLASLTPTHAGAIDNLGASNTFAGAITMNGPATIGASTGTLTLSLSVNNGGFLLSNAGAGNVNLNGVVTGAGGLTKGLSSGDTGTLSLNNIGNNYAGATTVNDGTLAGAGTVPGTLTINSGATLSPGSSSTPGTMNIGGPLTFNAGSTFNELISGGSASQLNVAGSVTLNSSPSPTLTLTGTSGVPAGSAVTLIHDTGGITGTFSVANNSQFSIASALYTGNGGTDLVLNEADQPPIVTVNGTASYTDGASALKISPTATVTDVDSPNLTSATVTISSGAFAGDSLSYTSFGGITGSFNSTSNVLLLTGSASPTAYQNVLDSLTFVSSSLNPTNYDTDLSRTITWSVSDGTFNSTPVTTNIAVVLVDAAPIVTTTASLTYTELSGHQFLDPSGVDVSVSDVDNQTLSSATVSITSGFNNVLTSSGFIEDVLHESATLPGGVTASYNTASGALTISGTATLAQYQALLEGVKYTNNSNDPSTTPRTISFVVNDGTLNSVAATETVTIIQIDQAPTVTFPSGVTTTINTPFSFTGANAISVGDVDANGNQEQVTLETNVGTLSMSATAAAAVSFSLGSGTSSSLMQFSGTLANLNTALSGLTFNPPASPTTGGYLLISINDEGNTGQGGPLTTSATTSLAVNSVGNAPTIFVTGGTTASFTELSSPSQLGSPVVIDNGVSLIDNGSSTISSATVTISSGFQNGQDVLGFTNTANITGSYTATSGTLILSGSDTAADYAAALSTVTYQDTSRNPNTTPRTITFQFQDANSVYSNTRSDTVNVVRVDQAPTISLPASPTVIDDGTLNLPGISVADVDSNGSAEQLTLVAGGNGTLSLTNTTGLTFSSGTSTNSLLMQFSGTLANINTDLSTLTFTPASGYNSNHGGSVSLSITINDQASASIGGPLSATASLPITIQPDHPATVTITPGTSVNYTQGSPPVVVDPSLTVSDSPDNRPNIAGATVTISGYVPGEDLLSFAPNNYGITGSFSSGVLTLTGSASPSAYQTVLDSVTYQDTVAPSSGYPSTVTRTIAFAANDGIMPGSPSMSAVNILPVNVSPVNTAPTSTVSVAQNGTFTFSGTNASNTISVSDIDAPGTGNQDQISLKVSSGTLSLAGSSGLSFVSGTATNSATMIFTGSLANINQALTGLVYTAPASAGTATLTFTSFDPGTYNSGSSTGIGRAQTVTNNVALNITAVSPTVNLSSFNPVYTQGAAPVFVDPNLTVTDAGNPMLASATISIASALPEDVLGVTANGPISVVSNSGGVLTLAGTASAAQYTAVLDSVTYADSNVSDPNSTPRTISFVVSDGTLSSTAAQDGVNHRDRSSADDQRSAHGANRGAELDADIQFVEQQPYLGGRRRQQWQQ